jgi:hypothetical protein
MKCIKMLNLFDPEGSNPCYLFHKNHMVILRISFNVVLVGKNLNSILFSRLDVLL